MKKIVALIACLGALAVGTGVAQASSTSCSYGLCQVSNNTLSRSPGSTATTAASESSLPFTGLDVGLLLAGGAGLLGAGVLVRRLSSDKS
jgi:hypothetical protein